MQFRSIFRSGQLSLFREPEEEAVFRRADHTCAEAGEGGSTAAELIQKGWNQRTDLLPVEETVCMPLKGAIGALPGSLVFENQRRPAHALSREGDIHFDAVGNLDEGNAAIHPVLLAVKGHCPLNRAGTCPLAGNRQCQLF